MYPHYLLGHGSAVANPPLFTSHTEIVYLVVDLNAKPPQLRLTCEIKVGKFAGDSMKVNFVLLSETKGELLSGSFHSSPTANGTSDTKWVSDAIRSSWAPGNFTVTLTKTILVEYSVERLSAEQHTTYHCIAVAIDGTHQMMSDYRQWTLPKTTFFCLSILSLFICLILIYFQGSPSEKLRKYYPFRSIDESFEISSDCWAIQSGHREKYYPREDSRAVLDFSEFLYPSLFAQAGCSRGCDAAPHLSAQTATRRKHPQN